MRGRRRGPGRRDADIAADSEDGSFVRDTLRFFELAEPSFRYTLRQAIGAGHLVPYRIYRALTVKTAAEDGFPVRRDELDWNAMDKGTRAEFVELFDSSDTITVDPRALERKFTVPERQPRDGAREFRDAHEKGFMGRDGVRRWPAWGKTIVFAVTRRHAETLAEIFDEHFADKKPHPTVRYADFVVSDVGGGPALDASAIVKSFKDEDYPKILVSVNMLDTGFDCPEAVNLVMARFTRSAILYRQMRGRGTRKAPHIGKTGFTIFDFVGVTDFHGDDEDIDGCTIREDSRPTPPGDPSTVLMLDMHDHIDPESRDWLTLDETGRLRGYDQARRVFGGGYPHPAQNAEQLSFLIYFCMYEAADAAGLPTYADACRRSGLAAAEKNGPESLPYAVRDTPLPSSRSTESPCRDGRADEP